MATMRHQRLAERVDALEQVIRGPARMHNIRVVFEESVSQEEMKAEEDRRVAELIESGVADPNDDFIIVWRTVYEAKPCEMRQ